MLGIVGLLTGWALLCPLLVAIYLRLGFPYMAWMAPLAGIAVSLPMLAFMTIAGLIMIAWSVGKLTTREDF
ncbi:MAG: hypothetical protein J0L81_08685 [Caulobacterales bacterium]|jgi:hypothetical protein|nr:hypothetical protein [Caulobacterales bacterium]